MLLGMVPKHSRAAGGPTKLRRVLHVTVVSGTGDPAAGRRLVGTCSWVQVPEDMAGGRGGLWPLAVLEGNVCPASRKESSGDTALERAQEQLLNREK